MVYTLFTCNLHIVYTKLQYYVFSPAARRIVEEGINQGTVAVYQNRPIVSVLLVRLHPDTEQQQHAPVPAAIQGRVEFGAVPLKEWGRGDEEDKAICTCSWWLLNGLQLTNFSQKKSLCPISRRLKT